MNVLMSEFRILAVIIFIVHCYPMHQISLDYRKLCLDMQSCSYFAYKLDSITKTHLVELLDILSSEKDNMFIEIKTKQSLKLFKRDLDFFLQERYQSLI